MLLSESTKQNLNNGLLRGWQAAPWWRASLHSDSTQGTQEALLRPCFWPCGLLTAIYLLHGGRGVVRDGKGFSLCRETKQKAPSQVIPTASTGQLQLALQRITEGWYRLAGHSFHPLFGDSWLPLII